jgi:hypothetical protein
MLFLCGFDPRFEEALLLLGRGGDRLLVVGNEGVIHAVEAGLPIEVVLAQSFSLMGQPRDKTPRLLDVLRKCRGAARSFCCRRRLEVPRGERDERSETALRLSRAR